MTRLISPVLEEFYEDGLMNILRMITKSTPEEERLITESIIYTSYGFFKTYQALELLLDRETGQSGEFSNTYGSNRNAFSLAWSAVDAAYALGSLARLRSARTLFKPSQEALEHLDSAAKARNYMDHLPSNFRNAAQAKGFSPLFGWFSYQFTPFYRDGATTANLLYVNQFASTHLKDSYSANVNELSSDAVLASIDNICLSVRKKDRVNLSRTLNALTLDLNEFSIKTQERLLARWSDPDVHHGGIRIPFPMMHVRGDRELPVDLYDIATPLNHNKVRAVVHVEPGE